MTAMTGLVRPAVAYLEIKKSSDTNPTLTEVDNDWAGQPSLVYGARLGNGPTRLELLGHGGRFREEPGIYSDLSGFDTALEQIAPIVVTLE